MAFADDRRALGDVTEEHTAVVWLCVFCSVLAMTLASFWDGLIMTDVIK